MRIQAVGSDQPKRLRTGGWNVKYITFAHRRVGEFPDLLYNNDTFDTKVKNEPGHSGDPYIQNMMYYKEYLLGRQFNDRRLPCILISIDGPSLAFSTTKRFLWTCTSCVLSFVSPFHHIEHIAGILRAFREAVQNLGLYYRTIPKVEQNQQKYPLVYVCTTARQVGSNTLKR